MSLIVDFLEMTDVASCLVIQLSTGARCVRKKKKKKKNTI